RESTGQGGATLNPLCVGAEGGSDIEAGPLFVRPYLGLGYANIMATTPGYCSGLVCGPSTSVSESHAALWPGVAGLFPVSNFFIGLDIRYVVMLNADDINGLALFAT